MIEVKRYGRHFAVYEGDWLLAVCVYRKGALAVKRRLEELLAQVSANKRRADPVS